MSRQAARAVLREWKIRCQEIWKEFTSQSRTIIAFAGSQTPRVRPARLFERQNVLPQLSAVDSRL